MVVKEDEKKRFRPYENNENFHEKLKWSDDKRHVLYNISERVLYLYIFSLYVIKRRKRVNVSEREMI